MQFFDSMINASVSRHHTFHCKITGGKRSRFIGKKNIDATSSFNSNQLTYHHAGPLHAPHIGIQYNRYHHGKPLRHRHHNNRYRKQSRVHQILRHHREIAQLCDNGGADITIVHYDRIKKIGKSNERRRRIAELADLSC